MSEIVLQTNALTKKYGNLSAVQSLSLEVYRGEVFGFLGPNGAGKTTSINMLCGLLKPDQGQVYINGVNITANGQDVRARVGVCPQEIVLWERLTCQEQLTFIGQMYGVTGKVARERAEQILADLGLSEKRNQQARTLSGGMQRRLNLAMALVHEPEIVVLDEPEAGLDPQSRVKVREYIQSLARKKTIILTTHNMDEADRLADRVAIIDHGKLLVVDTPAALKQQLGKGDVIEIGLPVPLSESAFASVQSALHGENREIRVEENGSRLSIRALHAVGELPSILHSLTTAGIQAGEVRVRENTLEDVFIQLTGRSLRE